MNKSQMSIYTIQIIEGLLKKLHNPKQELLVKQILEKIKNSNNMPFITLNTIYNTLINVQKLLEKQGVMFADEDINNLILSVSKLLESPTNQKVSFPLVKKIPFGQNISVVRTESNINIQNPISKSRELFRKRRISMCAQHPSQLSPTTSAVDNSLNNNNATSEGKNISTLAKTTKLSDPNDQHPYNNIKPQVPEPFVRKYTMIQVDNPRVYVPNTFKHANRTEQQVTNAINVNSSPTLVLDEEPYRKIVCYKMINNIGYFIAKYDGEDHILYKCFNGCPFKLCTESSLKNHIKDFHAGLLWNGWCQTCCRVIILRDRNSIDAELDHMLNFHINKLKENEPEIVQAKEDDILVSDAHAAEKAFNESPAIDLYPWIENCPYKKLNTAASIMLSETCLAAPYKCMQKKCIYFTSDIELFEKHLELHDKHDDDVGLCSYCVLKFSNIKLLISHLRNTHKYDIYQCPYCFYRAGYYDRNVLTHINKHHPKSSMVVIECLNQSKTIDDGTKKEKVLVKSLDYVKRYVPLFECTVIKCFEKFYLIDEFEEHMRNHTTDIARKCLKCTNCISIGDSVNHALNCLKLGYYQCIHCLHSEQSLAGIWDHISDFHPSRMPVFCQRSHSYESDIKKRNAKMQTSPEVLTVKYSNPKYDDVLTIKKNILTQAIKNERNVNSLSYELRVTLEGGISDMTISSSLIGNGSNLSFGLLESFLINQKTPKDLNI